MIGKINELKTKSNLKEVQSICEKALSAIDSAIYNNVTLDAKYEIERVAITNLFEELSSYKKDQIVNEWLETQKRLFTIKNLGLREAINSLKETKELKTILDQFKEKIDEGIHESLLYEQFITAMQSFSYFPSVGNAIKSISDKVNSYKSDIDITKVIETMKETRSNYLVPLIEDVVNNYLTDKNEQTKSQLKETLIKFTYDPFVRDIVNLVSLDATNLQLEYANAECDIDKIYSPVLYIGENEAVFNVKGIYYIKKGNNINRLHENEVVQLDSEFKSLCEIINKHNIVFENKGITLYFKNDKAIIKENEIIINDQKMNKEQFTNSVQVSEMTGNKEFFMLVEFINSNFNEIAEIDFVKSVYLKEDENYSADVFKLRDNVFITTRNINEGKAIFYRNINPIQAKNIMMEHLRFDISSIFENLLPDEEKIKAQINETKESYNSYIEDLIKKISEFKLNPFGKKINEQVIEALEEELLEVKNEYKDYLNFIERSLRTPKNLSEAITLNLDVDGTKYEIPIPTNNKEENGNKTEKNGDNSTGSVVGSENINKPASAITFDDNETELLGDTPSIPEDDIDLGVDDAEEEAEDAEKEAEEKEEEKDLEGDGDEKENGIGDEEKPNKEDEIKIDDETDIDDEDENKDEDEEEKEEMINKTDDDKTKKRKKKVFLKKKSITESFKTKLSKSLNEEIDITPEEAEGAIEINAPNKEDAIFYKYYQLKDGRKIKVAPNGNMSFINESLNEDHKKTKSSRISYILKNDKSCKKEDLQKLSDKEIEKKYLTLEKKLKKNINEGLKAFLVKRAIKKGTKQLQDIKQSVDGINNIKNSVKDLGNTILGDNETDDNSLEDENSNVNESVQLGDTVIFDKKKGYVIGQIGEDLIVQVQGSTFNVKEKDVKVLGAKVETLTPPFKFDKETLKLLFEQYVRCGIFMGNTPVKTNNCYVRYSDWKEANNSDPINIVVEGHSNLISKEQIKILEDVNDFANLDNYIPGAIIDEFTGEVTENVMINAIDYTNSIGDADPVRIIRGSSENNTSTDAVPKAILRTLSI